MVVNVFLFDDFEVMDAFGPVEILGRVPEHFYVRFISLRGGLITGKQEIKIWTEPLNPVEIEDIFLIPGGTGVKSFLHMEGENGQQLLKQAVEEERARAKGQMEAFFSRAGLKNTVTGKPITTLEEFDAWRADLDAARLQKDLKAGKLTPEALRSAVEQTPAIQALKKQQEQRAAEDEQRRQAEAKARVDAELAEIHKLDPAINTVEDLLSMPSAKAFYDLVRKGNSFLDAYRLANFDRLTTARAEAARQQALNNARGKDHLTGTGTPQGTGAATVPPDVKAEYLAFNPGATDAEIQKHYNRYMEKQRKE